MVKAYPHTCLANQFGQINPSAQSNMVLFFSIAVSKSDLLYLNSKYNPKHSSILTYLRRFEFFYPTFNFLLKGTIYLFSILNLVQTTKRQMQISLHKAEHVLFLLRGWAAILCILSYE